MSIYRNSLAFSVIHYYLSEFAKKHQFLLPPFPKHLQLIDVSSFISQAEDIVLGNSSSKEIIVNERLSSLFENIIPIFFPMNIENYQRILFSLLKIRYKLLCLNYGVIL